jgi:VWFA-related protein
MDAKRPLLAERLLGLLCVAAIGAATSCLGQNSEQNDGDQNVVRSRTTVVLVPALVRTKGGELVYTLGPDDFKLTDDGVPQALTLEPDLGSAPLAMVVVVEVGGAGARQFKKYPTIAPPIAPMLASIVGNVRHRIAVVTFDSRPTLVQAFTSDAERAVEALRSLAPGCTRQEHYDNCTGPHPVHDKQLGDNGAAILDSLSYAVDLLRTQPSAYRRAILLVSETLDRGSETTIAQAVRDVTDSNTAIYAVAYSTAQSEAKHYADRQLPTKTGGPAPLGWLSLSNPHPNPPHGCMGKDPNPDPDGPKTRWAKAYDCLVQLAPPLGVAKMAAIATVDGLKTNVPETVARITGGEYFKLGSEKQFESDLVAITNHLPNRYVLSFHPQAPHPGLHQIELKLPDYDGLTITARTSYWADESNP